MGSSFGKLFTISTFGESHGGGVGVIIDGCPPRLELDINQIQNELNRRRPGQSKITTPRNESDEVEILSGLLGNTTLGTPIAMVVRNTTILKLYSHCNTLVPKPRSMLRFHASMKLDERT